MTTLMTLEDLLLHEMSDLYDAENQLLDALPRMANAASHADLSKTFTDHLEQTQGQIARLRHAFDRLGRQPLGHQCDAMRGILLEGEQIIQAQGDPDVKDAALIAAAQRVEHYEIAGYGTARTLAKRLGYNDIADELQTTLNQEGEADKKLTKLAEGGVFTSGINKEAAK